MTGTLVSAHVDMSLDATSASIQAAHVDMYFSLVAGITQRRRSVWFRAKRRRYLKRFVWPQEVQAQQEASDAEFKKCLDEHVKAMGRNFVWLTDTLGDMIQHKKIKE